MEDTINEVHDSNSLIATIGESYEYIRVLITDSLEIKRLESLRLVKSFASRFLLGVFMLFLTFFIFTILIALSIYELYVLSGSLTFAMLATTGVLTLLMLTIYLSRNFLIYRRVEVKFDKFIEIAD